MDEARVSERSPAAVPGVLQEHPAIIGTLLYLQISSVGLIYDWSYYRHFGVNVFDFAEANDFLLAAFKEPFALSMSGLTVVLLLLTFVLYRTRFRRIWEQHAYLGLVFTALFLIAGLAYTALPPYWYGRKNADAFLRAPTVKHLVYLKAEAGAGTTVLTGVHLLGTTEKVAFLYVGSTRSVSAVPFVNIGRIEFPPESDQDRPKRGGQK